jgi:DNA topoisomerase-3
VAQELYDGQGKKIITYPRAEVRYLPQSLITDVPRIMAGLRNILVAPSCRPFSPEVMAQGDAGGLSRVAS